MWRCVVCDFYFFSLVMGTKEKGMSLPYQALAAADTVPTLEHVSCGCGAAALSK